MVIDGLLDRLLDASVIFFYPPWNSPNASRAGQALSPDLLVFLGQLEELLHSPAPWGRDWGEWV